MTTLKLHQVNALVAANKTKTARALTDAHHTLAKAPLLSGIFRSYQPKDDEGEPLPSESTRVQINAADALVDLQSALARMFDLQLAQDVGNTEARADIVVDGQVIVPQAPVTYLLWLDKRLVDLQTFVDKLPTLDPAETWAWDSARNCWAAEAVQTMRTKKVPRNHVKAEATERHPAQVDVYMEDVIVGTWTTVKLSGALPANDVRDLRKRVTALIDAVKVAREAANSIEVEADTGGAAVLRYLFG